MSLQKDIIIMWPSTVATIPTGFSRVSTLDGRFPKGSPPATNPNVTGGAATHTHTSPSHSHTLANHTHTFTLDRALGAGSTQSSSASNRSMACEHYHTGTSGNPTGGTTNGTAVTYGAASNLPPYYEVIFIKVDSGFRPIPAGAMVLTGQTTLPTGFSYCDGLNGTPDVREKYLRGAAAGQNAGATGGGYTNTHDISHTHTTNTHTHPATSGTPQGYCARASGGTGGGSIDTNAAHVHSFTLTAATQAINSYSGSLVTTETVEPSYKKLMAIMNTSGAPRMASKIIAMWLGTLASIPAGWKLCDGTLGTPDMRDYHLKIATLTSQISNTGGSNTHTHAAQSHVHTSPSGHSHPSATGSGLGHFNQENPSGGGSIYDQYSDVHALDTCQTVTASYDAANTTADSSNNEPEYRTVAFIQYEFTPTPGLLMAFI